MFLRQIMRGNRSQSRQLGFFAGMGMGLYSFDNSLRMRSECLGIVGYLGSDRGAGDICVQGLNALSVRGYDSCGLATIDLQEGRFQITKYANEERFGGDSLQKLIVAAKSAHKHDTGLAHTRWATHGEKNEVNAHPHTDHKGRLALVHNGIIENYKVLKEELMAKSHLQVKGDTDSEVIACLIGAELDKEVSLMEAIKSTCSKLIGSYNIAILYLHDVRSIYLVKNSGEMAIGRKSETNQLIISSDADILRNEFDISDTTMVKDNEIVRVQPNSVTQLHIGSSEGKVEVKLKPGIKHYFIQEMLEQPDAVAKCLNYGARLQGPEKGMVKLGGLETNQQKLLQVQNLLIGGCGTSFYASLYGQYLMREFGCFKTVEVKIASEIVAEDFPLKNGGLLSVSQSGETTDLLKPFMQATELGLVRFNIVNNVESTLARKAKCGVFLNAGKELSVASTKAFVCQEVALSLITLWYSQNLNYKKTKDSRVRLWNELLTLSEKVKDVVDRCPKFSSDIAQILKNEKHVFLLGLGLAEIITKEGSLKLKELTYKHCQSCSLSNISNSYYPFAKKYPKTPTFFVILDDRHKEEALNFLRKISEVCSSRVFVISDCSSEKDLKCLKEFSEYQFYVPKSGYLSALLCVIPIQLAAFETTLTLGRDPDNPRSLSKVVS